MWEKIKAAARKAWGWIKRSWSWLRWVLAAVAAVVLWRALHARISSLVDWVSKPAKWAKIPGVQTHVVALNPNTGAPETVELPAGVKASDVTSVGISEVSGGYHVEALHTARDRRAMLRGDK
jgi:hypothetical protein